ncbi:MAG: beta-lactamase family protein [Gemmatimonadetes bacterium]|nr:beta-lactamase family protein [Gemmatimonadota bacterium]
MEDRGDHGRDRPLAAGGRCGRRARRRTVAHRRSGARADSAAAHVANVGRTPACEGGDRAARQVARCAARLSAHPRARGRRGSRPGDCLAGASGMADIERKIPASPATLYSICSISKLFTSISVMQLRDRGLVRLDDPVERHLPWFNIKRTHPASGAITVEGLLTHASGLPREAAFPYWSAPSFEFPTRQQIIDALSSEGDAVPQRDLLPVLEPRPHPGR